MLNNEELCQYVLHKAEIIDELAIKYGVRSDYSVLFFKPESPGLSVFCYSENESYHFLSFKYANHSDSMVIKIDTADLVEIAYCALWHHVYDLSNKYVQKLFEEIDCCSEKQMRVKNSFFCEMYAALGDEYLAYAIEAVKIRNPDYLKKNAMLRIGTLPPVLIPRKYERISQVRLTH